MGSFVLIIFFFMYGSGVSVTSVPGFASMEACNQAKSELPATTITVCVNTK